MAMSYKLVAWDIARKTVESSAWAKNDTGRGIRVIIVVNGLAVVPETETLRMRFKTLEGLDGSTAGVIVNGAYNIELDAAVLNRTKDIQVDLELTVGGKTISSQVFTIPVFKSIG